MMLTHPQIGNCQIELEFEIEEKVIALVKSQWRSYVNYHRDRHFKLVDKPVYYAIWSPKDKGLQNGSVVEMLTPSGRPKSKSSAIREFLKMSQTLKQVNIS